MQWGKREKTMNRDFKGIWIPREIWLHPELSLQAKVLWAEIFSLNDREAGGCYASNEYLCDFLGVKLSRLKEVLKELRDSKLLEDVSFNGRSRIIRSIVPSADYGGHEPAGKPAITQPENRLPDSRKTGTLPYIRDTSKDTSKDNTPLTPKGEAAKAADVSLESKKLTEEIIEVLRKAKPTCEIPAKKTSWYQAAQKLLDR